MLNDEFDPARSGDFSVEVLIEFFDRQLERLVGFGVAPDRIADAMIIIATRAEILHGASGLRKLGRLRKS